MFQRGLGEKNRLEHATDEEVDGTWTEIVHLAQAIELLIERQDCKQKSERVGINVERKTFLV